MSRQAEAIVLAAAIAALAVAGPIGDARAVEVSSQRLQELATEAATDPAAAEQLREVTSVDGRPAEVRAALAGAEGKELAARAEQVGRTVDTGSSAVPVPEQADELLRQSGAGSGSQPASEGGSPSGSPLGIDPLLALLAAALLVAAAAAAATRFGSRRLPVEVGADGGAVAGGERTEADWAKLATEAERGGDFAAAVRYRYRAGLRSLDRAGLLEARPSLTSGEVRRLVFSPRLDGLLSSFEEIAYGGRRAEPDDAETAGREWPRAIEEARRG